MRITLGGPGDVDAVLALLDGATAWLAEVGRTGQWGTEPASSNPRRVARVTELAGAGRLHLARIDGEVAGALAVGDEQQGFTTTDSFAVGEWPGQILVRRLRSG